MNKIDVRELEGYRKVNERARHLTLLGLKRLQCELECLEVTRREHLGICQVETPTNTFLLLEGIYGMWPKCATFASGFRNVIYPVPSPDPNVTSDEYFELTSNKWDKTTQYGRDRWELLEFCLEVLEVLEVLIKEREAI